MGDEYRLRLRGGSAATWLAAAERAASALGLSVLDRGERYLALSHADADVASARRWGGHLRIDADPEGLWLVFHLGTRRKEIVARLEAELRAGGLAVEVEAEE